MNEQPAQEKENKKGFLARLMEKLDKKLENASEKKGCGCSSNNEKDSSCC